MVYFPSINLKSSVRLWIENFFDNSPLHGSSTADYKGKRYGKLRVIIRCSFLCVAFAVFIIGFTIYTLRFDAIQDASRDAGNIAAVLADQTSRSLQSVDAALIEIQNKVRHVASADDFRERFKDEATFEYIKDRLARFPQADVITLADDRGDVVMRSSEWPAPSVNLLDREFFQHFLQSNDSLTFIAAPVVSRVSGKSIIFFSRRLTAANGTLVGVVLIGLEPTYFRNIYESITALQDQSFQLVRNDGSIIVEHPLASASSHKIPSNSPWYATVSEGGGHYRFKNQSNEFEIGESRAAGRYPIFVNVTVSENVALEIWNRRTILIGLGTLLIVVCPAFLLLMIRSLFKSVIRSEQSLEENAHQLVQLNERIDLAFNNMSQGLCFFDGEKRLIVCNKRFIDMYNLVAEDVYPGITLDEIVDLRWNAGTSPKMSRKEYLDWRKSISVSERPSDTVVELKNGCFFRISHRPMPDGGWVATHEDVTAAKRDEARISYMAHHDALTGLANRTFFTQKLEGANSLLDKEHRFGILMLDLDRFKMINDSMGHSAGDTLLREVSERLRNVAGENDVIARLGGDEFAIITPGNSIESQEPHHDGALALARGILNAINEPFIIENKSVFIGTSIGIALAPDDGSEPEDLLKKADLALYQSKSRGRNLYSLFDPSMLAENTQLHKLEADMRLGLAKSEFEVFYQPIYNARSRKIAGAEALVRWRHAERGLISPATFIPLAESTGLIVPLGEFVLHRACCDAVLWPGDLKLSVNLSAIQFRKSNLFDVIMCALIESGLPPERLEVEVTESVLMENHTEYAALLHQLKSIGVSVALDDFGTGYSSLSYLKQFPFDKIKIDRSFIADVAEHEGSMAIISAIISMSRTLNMTTTAEGVETERQLEIMRAAGVTLIQGYLLGRPCSISSFNTLLLQDFLREVAG